MLQANYKIPYIYIYIYILYIYYHVVTLARISLTLSRHFTLSFIASGRSSGLHPISSYSCCMNVRAGRPAFARPYAGVHRSTSLMTSSLLLQQCPALLCFSLGSSAGVFFILTRHTCRLIIFVFSFYYNFFPKISVCRICRLYNQVFFFIPSDLQIIYKA